MRTGIQMSATATTSRTSELDSHSVIRVPVPRFANSGGAPPPGFSRISSATPPQMKPVVSVTITSGTRETMTRSPLTAPMAAPAARIARASHSASPKLASFIVRAARTFATAITDPIDRSIPPEITTTACAAAAHANGNAAIATDCASNELNRGWIATVAIRKTRKSTGMPNSAGYRTIAPQILSTGPELCFGAWTLEDRLSADSVIAPVDRTLARWAAPWRERPPGHVRREATFPHRLRQPASRRRFRPRTKQSSGRTPGQFPEART